MTGSLKIYQVDAFAQSVFSGNPAAVIPLKEWLDASVMQAIAEENNLSETAFFIPHENGFHLRWFTPKQEVRLCGHATLASAFIVFTILDPSCDRVNFETLSGSLVVNRSADDRLSMKLPKWSPLPCEPPSGLIRALGPQPQEVLFTEPDSNFYVVYSSEDEVQEIQADLSLLEKLHPFGVVVTAKGNEVDFVSRYFAPSYGIPEDPVTGSIHCALTPYWSEKLGKKTLLARQVSQRGGELLCEELDEHVLVSGYATLYLEGELTASALYRPC